MDLFSPPLPLRPSLSFPDGFGRARGRRRWKESRCSPTREGVYQGVCGVRNNEEFALHETAIPVRARRPIYRLCNSECIADVKPPAHVSHTPAHADRIALCTRVPCAPRVDNSRAKRVRRPRLGRADLRAGSENYALSTTGASRRVRVTRCNEVFSIAERDVDVDRNLRRCARGKLICKIIGKREKEISFRLPRDLFGAHDLCLR